MAIYIASFSTGSVDLELWNLATNLQVVLVQENYTFVFKFLKIIAFIGGKF